VLHTCLTATFFFSTATKAMHAEVNSSRNHNLSLSINHMQCKR